MKKATVTIEGVSIVSFTKYIPASEPGYEKLPRESAEQWDKRFWFEKAHYNDDGEVILTYTSTLCTRVEISPSESFDLDSGDCQEVTVSPNIPPDTPCGEADITYITATLYCDQPGAGSAIKTATLRTIVPSPVRLPVIARNLSDCFPRSWETEDNDRCDEANGRLCPGREYYGYPDDAWDFFSIGLLPSGRQVEADLTIYAGEGVQFQFFDGECEPVGPYRWKAPYHIEYSIPKTDQYYISIYTTEDKYSTEKAYTLWVEFP